MKTTISLPGICLLWCLLAGRASGQTNFYQNLSVGGSAGKGFGIDAAYGKRSRDIHGRDQGWDLAFSLWTNEYRLPFTTDNTPAFTSSDYANGAYL